MARRRSRRTVDVVAPMPWVTIVLFAAVIFALSLALTYMLRLIPAFRKYVL